MRATSLLAVFAVAVVPTLPLAAGDRRAAAEGARLESLPDQLREGDTIRLPEGFLRVEGPEEPGPAGSFSVAPAEEVLPYSCGGRCPAAIDIPPEPPPTLPPPPARRPRGMGLCEPERAAFLKELLRISGVEEVSDPLALIAAFTGEGAGDVPSLRFPEWGLLPVDPVRALAWNFELQIRAHELSECIRDPDRPRVDPRFHPRGTAGPATAPSGSPPPGAPTFPAPRPGDALVASGR